MRIFQEPFIAISFMTLYNSWRYNEENALYYIFMYPSLTKESVQNNIHDSTIILHTLMIEKL